MSFECMNCGKDYYRHWEGVPVCIDCHKVATHLMQRSMVQVKMMLTAQKDAIRERLSRGRLVLGNRKDGIKDEGTKRSPGGVPAPLHTLSEGPGNGRRSEPETG